MCFVTSNCAVPKMPIFDSSTLATWSSGHWHGHAPAAVCGFGNDTRSLKAGEAFVALRTARRDGHDFLDDARARGASCALVSRVVANPLPQLVVKDSLGGLQHIAAAWRATLRLPVIGVTGSVGKTSAKEMLRATLGPRAYATSANLNNTLGVPLALLQVEPGLHSAAVIEAGMSEPGELGVSARVIRPDIAVVTNVRSVHLSGLGTLAAIAQEKSELVRALAPSGEAFVLAETLRHAAFAELATACVALCREGEPAPNGVRRRAHFTLKPVSGGWLLLVTDPELGELASTLGPISRGQATNAALAALAAVRAGAKPSTVTDALATWRPLPGRGSVHWVDGRPLYVDCYNASPASLADAAEAFVRQTEGSRLFVIGGMAELGADSPRLHREAGASLPLSSGDSVIGFGGDAPALAAACGGKSIDDVVALAASIQAHRGPVFIKGSRAHALERVLPAALRETLGFH